MAKASPRPLYLLADSQLLFSKQQGRLLLEAALDESVTRLAAYVGASNGDRREFYDVFEAAADAAGIRDRRMIRSSFGSDDRAFLEHAQLIVLAGGDVGLGWQTLEQTGMKEVILRRHARGAVLVGISAGAVQLGRYEPLDGPAATASSPRKMFDLVPMIVDAHDEHAGWARLSRTVEKLRGEAIGLGIPAGGGVVAHAGGVVKPLRRPAHEFRFEGTHVTHSVLRTDLGHLMK